MQNDPGILITAIGSLLLGLLVFFEGLNGWKIPVSNFLASLLCFFVGLSALACWFVLAFDVF
ncbi:transmembrane protein [Pseudomonas phage E2005-C]|nr:transmembrane protein [Pseudomonas phage E2005-C]